MRKVTTSTRRSLSAPTASYRPLARSRVPAVPFAMRQKTEKQRQTRNLESISSSPNLHRQTAVDAASVSRILTEFVSKLTLSKSTIEEVNTAIKALKGTVSHFSRFSHLKQEHHTEFWNAFDGIASKCRDAVKTNAQSHSVSQVADQLRRAKNGLMSVQEKSHKPIPEVVTTLFTRFDQVEEEIREADLTDGLAPILKDLRQLQAAVPTQRCNQEIGRVMLALQSAKDAVRLKSGIDALIQQTEDKLKAHIPRKAKEPSGRRRSDGVQSLRRTKSTASGRFSIGFDDKMSFTSALSRKSSKSSFTVVNAAAKKAAKLSLELEKLNRERSRLEDALEEEKGKEEDLKQQLDKATSNHDSMRASFQKQISQKYKKSKNPDFVKVEAQILELRNRKQALKAELAHAEETGRPTMLIDIEYYKERLRFLEIYRESQDAELQRVEDIRNSLEKNADEQMGVKLDNHRLVREADKLRGEIEKTSATIEQLQSVRESELLIDALRQGQKISKEKRTTAYQKASVEHEMLLRWKQQLQDEVSDLTKTLDDVTEQAPKEDCTEELKQVNMKCLRQLGNAGATARTEENRREIEKLKKEVQITKPPLSSVAKLRKQNEKLLAWVRGILSQVLDVEDRCQEREAQVASMPENKKLLKIADRLRKANFAMSKLKAENDDCGNQILGLFERLSGRKSSVPATDVCSLFMDIKEYLRQILAPDPDELVFESEEQREEYEQCVSEREAILKQRDLLVSLYKKA